MDGFPSRSFFLLIFKKYKKYKKYIYMVFLLKKTKSKLDSNRLYLGLQHDNDDEEDDEMMMMMVEKT